MHVIVRRKDLLYSQPHGIIITMQLLIRRKLCFVWKQYFVTKSKELISSSSREKKSLNVSCISLSFQSILLQGDAFILTKVSCYHYSILKNVVINKELKYDNNVSHCRKKRMARCRRYNKVTCYREKMCPVKRKSNLLRQQSIALSYYYVITIVSFKTSLIIMKTAPNFTGRNFIKMIKASWNRIRESCYWRANVCLYSDNK